MLQFDDRISKLLANAYDGADFVRRRAANARALDPGPGDTVLDIGCGPGHLTLELADAVGDGGRILGIDPSRQMREKAQARCGDRPNIAIVEGDALNLPADDGTIDKAVSVQVFEYLDDIPGALAEARRSLRPAGRLVIGDIHWDSLAWFSEDRPRMQQIMDAWDTHLTERGVPSLLPGLMVAGGFDVESVEPVTFTDTQRREGSLAWMLSTLIEAYVLQNDLVDRQTVVAFAEEQQRLLAEDRFFFSLSHFVIAGRKKP